MFIGKKTILPVESNGGVPTNLQDQTTRPVILNFNKVSNSTTLSVVAVKTQYTITVADTTGFADKAYIIIFDPTSSNFSFYRQVGAPAGNVITLDTALDYNYPIGANVDVGSINLAVDGSGTPQVFGLRGTGVIPGVEITVDFTNIHFSCTCSNPVDLAKFGDVAALTRGLVLRKRDGLITNYFNVKTNGEIRSTFGDFTPYLASNPAQNVDGFGATFTAAGQQNIGVSLRVPVGEDIELVVQDKIDTLTSLNAVAVGHLLQN